MSIAASWNGDFARGPWFAPVAAPAAALAGLADWPDVATLDLALRPWLTPAGVRLVAALPAAARGGPRTAADVYELRVADAGEVPTRARSWHDLLNALQWAVFPRAKRALTAALAVLQRGRVAGGGPMPGRRAPVHDRLALVDEGGLVVLTAPGQAIGDGGAGLAAAVAAGQATALVFGHALLEHALSGQRTVRAAAVVLEVAAVPAGTAARVALADAALAAALAQGDAAWRPRTPGWAIDDRWLR